MNLLRVRRLFAGERVARFGITGPGGRPHMMPVSFALIDDGDDGVVVCVLGADRENEPPSIATAARLREVLACPRVSFLVDHSRDAGARWWVQADAVAEVLRRGTSDPRFDRAASVLVDRYPAEHRVLAARTVLWNTVTAWSGWTAAVDRIASVA